MPKVLALSGGVGGAKLVAGLADVLPPDSLTVLTNTADDFTHLGLRICPDLDSVLYALSGQNDTDRGWGVANESWQFLDQLKALGREEDAWFQLGDRDLALHISRSQWLAEGLTLTEVCAELTQRMQLPLELMPMCDQPVATIVHTNEGDLPFQDYFVRRQCEPVIQGVSFAGAEEALPNQQLMQRLASGYFDLIVICPSNPFVSVAPLLVVPGLHEALMAANAKVVAVSPIVGGKALKGPAAKMMRELALDASVLGVAEHYQHWVQALVIDAVDEQASDSIKNLGMQVLTCNTIMTDRQSRASLANEILTFSQQ